MTEAVAYRTVLEDAHREGAPDVYGMLLDGQIDVVTFTSASAVRNFASIYGADRAADLLRRTTVAAIGPVTAEAAAQLGITTSMQPATCTIPALVDAIVAHADAARAREDLGMDEVPTQRSAVLADAAAAPAAAHRRHPVPRPRDAPVTRQLHLPAVRLRRRGRPQADRIDARRAPAGRWTRSCAKPRSRTPRAFPPCCSSASRRTRTTSAPRPRTWTRRCSAPCARSRRRCRRCWW